MSFLYNEGNDDLDANDLALLALFNGVAAPPPKPDAYASAGGSASQASNTGRGSPGVVVGQPLAGPATHQPAAPAPSAVAAPVAAPQQQQLDPVHQLQYQAVMQHQAAIMQNPQAYPTAAAQLYLLQQQQALAARAAFPHAPAAAATYAQPAQELQQQQLVGSKRAAVKVEEEVEDQQTERVKKRRRESAQRSRQRSRQRKNAYMHALEVENRALKAENERLRLKASRSGSAVGIGAGASYVGPAAGSTPLLPMLPPLLQQQQQARASSGSVSRQPHEFDCSGGSEHCGSLLSDDEDELCDPLMEGGLLAALGAGPCNMAPDLLPMPAIADLAFNFAF